MARKCVTDEPTASVVEAGKTLRKFSRWLSGTWLVAALTSCAGLDGAKSAEELVAERALEQAYALMESDYESAIQYTTPAYRASRRSADYKLSHGGTGWWRDVSVKSVECEAAEVPERCDVRLLVSVYRPLMTASTIEIPVDQIWIFIEKQWYVFED